MEKVLYLYLWCKKIKFFGAMKGMNNDVPFVVSFILNNDAP